MQTEGHKGGSVQAGEEETKTNASLLEILRELQRKLLHAKGTYFSSSGNDKTLLNALRRLSALNTALNDADWIPYLSRLARLHGISKEMQVTLMKLIELHAGQRDLHIQSQIKRLAIVLRSGVPKPNLGRFEHRYIFAPILAFISRESNIIDPAVITEVLFAFIATCERTRRDRGDILLHDKCIPPSWIPILQDCVRRLEPGQRPDVLRRLNVLGSFLMSSSSAPEQISGHCAVAKLKIKSLKSSPPFGPSAPVAHCVYAQNMGIHMAMEESSLNVKLQNIRSFDYSRQFDGFVESVSANLKSRKELTELKLALESSQVSLNSEKLLGLTMYVQAEKHASTELLEVIAWNVVVSLSQNADMISTLDESSAKNTLQCLLSIATRTSSHTTVEALITTVGCYFKKQHFTAADFARIKRLLQNYAQDDAWVDHENLLAKLMLLLCELSSPAGFDSSCTSIVAGLLEQLREASRFLRLSCSQYLSLATTDVGNEQPLDLKLLQFLVTLAQNDESEEVRVYAKVTFANGLWNNKDLHPTSDDLLPLVSVMFTTCPVKLTIAGYLPKDYTDSINGPLLKFIDGVSKLLPSGLVGKLCRFVQNIASRGRQSGSGMFSRLTKGCLRILIKFLSKFDLLRGTLEAVETLFLVDDTATDDNSIAFLEFMVNCIELKRVHLSYKASDQLLQKIAVKLMRGAHPIYTIVSLLFSWHFRAVYKNQLCIFAFHLSEPSHVQHRAGTTRQDLSGLPFTAGRFKVELGSRAPPTGRKIYGSSCIGPTSRIVPYAVHVHKRSGEETVFCLGNTHLYSSSESQRERNSIVAHSPERNKL